MHAPHRVSCATRLFSHLNARTGVTVHSSTVIGQPMDCVLVVRSSATPLGWFPTPQGSGCYKANKVVSASTIRSTSHARPAGCTHLSVRRLLDARSQQCQISAPPGLRTAPKNPCQRASRALPHMPAAQCSMRPHSISDDRVQEAPPIFPKHPLSITRARTRGETMPPHARGHKRASANQSSPPPPRHSSLNNDELCSRTKPESAGAGLRVEERVATIHLRCVHTLRYIP